MARNPNSGWSRKWSAFFATIIVLGGVAVSLGFAVRLRDALQRNAESRMHTASATLRTTVDEQLSRYIDTVRLTAAALAALPDPTRHAFQEVTTAVASQKLTAARSIRFVVPAGIDEDLGAVRARWVARGARGLALTPLDGANQHLFTVFSRTLDKGAAPSLGVDQAAASAEVEVTRQARETNGVAVSDAYVLLTDTKAAAGRQQLSFDVTAPVPGPRGTVAGYVMLSIGGTDFVTALLTRAAGDLLDAQLLTRAASGTLTPVASVLHDGRSPDVRYVQEFATGQRQWVLRTSTDNQTLLPTAGRTDMVVLLSGSVLAVMFGTLMYLQMSSTQRMEREIEDEVVERLNAASLPHEPVVNVYETS